jgi:large subunit ribosomal protein L19e
MDLKVQKRLAAQILECSSKRVVFDNERLDDIKQAITKRDLKLLIGDGAIRMAPMNSTSRVRARKIQVQKSKGRRKGAGSRKGSFNSRFQVKMVWMNNLRVQREFLKLLLEKSIITRNAYRKLYLMSKGGYFRSRRHIKLFLAEHDEMLMKSGSVSVGNEDVPATKIHKRTKTTKTKELKDQVENDAEKDD